MSRDTRRGDAETRGRGETNRSRAMERGSFLGVSVSPCLRVLFHVLLLLLTAHCTLLTASAQPGVPMPSSPLYGARP